ncbi:MAG: hypothetical protein AB8B69_17445 [Chitinophagales bacterium]
MGIDQWNLPLSYRTIDKLRGTSYYWILNSSLPTKNRSRFGGKARVEAVLNEEIKSDAKNSQTVHVSHSVATPFIRDVRLCVKNLESLNYQQILVYKNQILVFSQTDVVCHWDKCSKKKITLSNLSIVFCTKLVIK